MDIDENLRIDTRTNLKNGQYTINVMMRDLDQLTAKQAEIYLKSLIAKALQTAVMENYSSIQRIVDEFIHSDECRKLIEDSIKAEIKRRTDEAIKDMFS